MGAWASYGLGSDNDNLPGYVVLNGGQIPSGGLDCFSNGFLPATARGSLLNAIGAPLANITSNERSAHSQALKRRLIGHLNQQVPEMSPELEAAIANYELAARMQLAAQGLPASVPEGYDSISEIPMGSSRTVENVRLKQSQEIELARSISEIEGLVAARVHLAIPEKSVFARASVPPSASVFVQMEDGRSLSRQQISAIVHLVSSSVPSLPKGEVTVVDQYGNLLSQPGRNAASAMTDSQLEHRIRLEDIYRQRIISIVTPMVGGGNVMALHRDSTIVMANVAVETLRDSMALMNNEMRNLLVRLNAMEQNSRFLSDSLNSLKLETNISEKNMNEAMRHLSRSLRYFYAGDYREALKEVDLSLEFNPNMALAYARRGSIYYKLGDVQRAKINWNLALRYDPEYTDVRNILKALNENQLKSASFIEE